MTERLAVQIPTPLQPGIVSLGHTLDLALCECGVMLGGDQRGRLASIGCHSSVSL